MDAVDTLQNASSETKAERIARYKAERRRELAERYGNVEEVTSRYTRKDRKVAETTEKVKPDDQSSGSDPSFSSRTRSRMADREQSLESVSSKGTLGDEKPAMDTPAPSKPEPTTTMKSRMADREQSLESVSSKGTLGDEKPDRETPAPSNPEPTTTKKIISGYSLLKDDDVKQPTVTDRKTDDGAKMSMASKTSLFKGPEKTEGSSPITTERCRGCANDDNRASTQPITIEEIAVAGSPPKGGVMENTADMVSWDRAHMTLSTSSGAQTPNVRSKSEEDKGPSQPALLLRQDSRSGIKGILKKSRSTSLESDYSEGGPPDPSPAPGGARPTSITLSHPESGEEEDMEEKTEEVQDEDEQMTEDDNPDGGCFSTPQILGAGGRGGFGEDLQSRSPSPGGSREEEQTPSLGDKTSSVDTEDGEDHDFDSSLDSSTGSVLKERLAELNSGDEEWKAKLKKPKPSKLVQKSLADRFNQLQDSGDAWKKKKSSADVETKMSLADRMKILQDNEEAWKSRGRGAANDSTQFTVAGRMAKRGLVSEMGKDESPISHMKKSIATPVKPHEEISSQTGVTVEGDKRLDKLESFLDKLHNKGMGNSRTSTIEVTAETEKEVMTLDDEETFGRFYKPVSPSTRTCGITLTAEDLYDLQANTPKLTSAGTEHKRAVRPARNNPGSRNPLRALASRNDIRQGYTEQRLNVATVETKRIQVERMAKHSNLADAALAGLASKENFRKVHLRSTKSTEVVTNNSTLPFHKLMLIRIKGRRHVQVRLVEPTARFLNSGDCFLLITPKQCFMWSGEFANVIEKAKASEMAAFVQAKRDLGCKAPQVTVLEEGINTDSRWAKEFWNLLGGKTDYRGAGEPEEDELYESGVLDSNGVYRLLEDKLVPYEEAWASIPSVTLLNSKEALVFDFGSEVYVWTGKDVSLADRKVAVQLGKQLWSGFYDYSGCRVNPLDACSSNIDIPERGEGRPSWTLFGRLSEHNETALFREKFLDWAERKKDEAAVEEAKSPINSTLRSPIDGAKPDILKPCDAKALLNGTADPLRCLLEGVDVQRGHGPVRTEDGRQAELATVAVDAWHIREFEEEELPPTSLGQLHEGDTYVIRWKYSVTTVVGKRQKPGELSSGGPGRERSACFFWQGRHSSVSGKGTSALMTVELGSHRGAQVLVAQGKEPPCFLQLFQGGLVIHKGSREDGKIRSTGTWRLYCVRSEAVAEASLVEVECCCASLRSRATLVLLGAHQGQLYLWHGCKSHAGAREVGTITVERLQQMHPSELGLNSNSSLKVKVVEEGTEPAGFWNALGQQDRKAYDCMLQDPGKYNFTPRLFHLSASSGVFEGEELLSPARVVDTVMAMPFLQENLYSVQQPALFMLDNRMEVYLWQGQQPDPEECTGSAKTRWENQKKCAMETVLQYCKEKNSRRPPQAYLVLAGSEPLTFTNIFPYWERDPSIIPQAEGARTKVTLVQDALNRLSKNQYSVEELTAKPLPEGVDPLQLEIYLSDQDFQEVLEMSRTEFNALPNWKQKNLKKSKGLF